MNRHFLPFALYLLPLGCLAQNWSPLTRSEQFNFRHADSAAISHTIRVDSVRVVGADSLFFLNRVVERCLDCALDASGFGKWLRNRGQFLQKSMLKKPDGTVVFQGERTFTLLTQADVGESWLFDTLQNITALVIANQAETVFGVADPVKTISLSNGYSLRLSQSHGLLSFPEVSTGTPIELVGIEGRNVGERLPTYREMFDFQPGDVFQYDEEFRYSYVIRQSKTKYTILQREEVGNTRRYIVQLNQKISATNHGMGGPPTFVNSTLVWTFTPDTIFWLADGPQQLIKVNDFSYGQLSVWKKPVWGLTKYIGRAFPYNQNEYPNLFEPTPTTESDTMKRWFTNRIYAHHFSVGFGETYFDIDQPYSLQRQLIGAVKNGDTIGIVLNDYWTNAVAELPKGQSFWQVKENPSRSICQVVFSEPLQQPAALQIWSSAGQLIYSNVLPIGLNDWQVPISDLRSGVYSLQIIEPTRTSCQKVVFLD